MECLPGCCGTRRTDARIMRPFSLGRVAAGFVEAEACRTNGSAFFCRIKQREATNRRAYHVGFLFGKGRRTVMDKSDGENDGVFLTRQRRVILPRRIARAFSFGRIFVRQRGSAWKFARLLRDATNRRAYHVGFLLKGVAAAFFSKQNRLRRPRVCRLRRPRGFSRGEQAAHFFYKYTRAAPPVMILRRPFFYAFLRAKRACAARTTDSVSMPLSRYSSSGSPLWPKQSRMPARCMGTGQCSTTVSATAPPSPPRIL